MDRSAFRSFFEHHLDWSRQLQSSRSDRKLLRRAQSRVPKSARDFLARVHMAASASAGASHVRGSRGNGYSLRLSPILLPTALTLEGRNCSSLPVLASTSVAAWLAPG